MKKLLVGTAIGIAAGYAVYKMAQQGKLDCLCDDIDKYSKKAKRNLKTIVDAGKNQAEYVKDRIEYEYENGKEKLSKLGE